jgi:hypothetical protein
MFSRIKKIGAVTAALALVLGTLAACAELPTASSTAADDCIIMDGVIYCPPGS